MWTHLLKFINLYLDKTTQTTYIFLRLNFLDLRNYEPGTVFRSCRARTQTPTSADRGSPKLSTGPISVRVESVPGFGPVGTCDPTTVFSTAVVLSCSWKQKTLWSFQQEGLLLTLHQKKTYQPRLDHIRLKTSQAGGSYGSVHQYLCPNFICIYLSGCEFASSVRYSLAG